MAEGGSDDNDSTYNDYLDSSRPQNRDGGCSETEEASASSRPDLCNENSLNTERKHSGESLPSSHNDPPKREENPFSFKHFLNRDVPSNTNYQQTGARPKVFSTSRQHSLPASGISNAEPLRMSSVDNVRSEYPSVLPDFVQDHLVVEQCYLGNDTNTVDIENLPDFTLNRSNDSPSAWHVVNHTDDSTNDLTSNLTSNRRRTHVEFPLDLPLSSEDANPSVNGSRSCPQSGEVGVSKSLPDFLSDGPIHSNRISNEPLQSAGSGQSSAQSAAESASENEILREQIHLLRQQLVERNGRIQCLERDIAVIQQKEQSYIEALSKSMEQVEGNISSNVKRVVTAENTISKLKQEVKSLKSEVNFLRQENNIFREQSLGAAGGGVGPSESSPIRRNETSARYLAQELRGATSGAERTLRNLLDGLTNLRVIADSIEHMHRVHEPNDPWSYDVEDESGPNL